MGWLRGRERLWLVVILLAGACLTGLVLYSGDPRVFVYSGDAISHLVRTRQFVDSQQTGIHNVGTAWLPLPHLLLLPFAAIDFLFYHGLAAVIPGMACLVGAALALFGIIRRLTGSRQVALLGALLVGLNPNVLYLSLIPMSEASFLLFLSATAYCLLRWMEQPAALRWLGLCSATLCCATLSRYETWPLPAALVLISAQMIVSRQIPGGWRRYSPVLLISLASSLGILAWFWWNSSEYGDPFQFARAIYDIGPSDSRETLQGRPIAVILLYGKTVLYMFGPVLLGFATAAIGRGRHDLRRSLLFGFLFLPPIFTLVSLEQGFAQMDRWWWNSRYVLPIVIPLVLAACIVVHRLWADSTGQQRKVAVMAALFSFFLVQVTIPSVGVVTFIDAAKTYFEESVYATEVGERLGEVYQGGRVALLAGSGQGHRIMIPSGIPISRFRVIGGRDSAGLRSAPWKHNRYFVLCKDPDPEAQALAGYWLHHFSLLAAYYVIVSENPEYLLFERKQDRILRNVSANTAP